MVGTTGIEPVTPARLTEKGVSRILHTKQGQKQYVIFDQGMPKLILKVGRKTKTFFWDGMTPSGRRQYKPGIFPSTGLDQAVFDQFIDSVMIRDHSDFTVETQSTEFKREAMKFAAMPDVTLSQVAKNLGINEGLRGRWKHELEARADIFDYIECFYNPRMQRRSAVVSGNDFDQNKLKLM